MTRAEQAQNDLILAQQDAARAQDSGDNVAIGITNSKLAAAQTNLTISLGSQAATASLPAYNPAGGQSAAPAAVAVSPEASVTISKKLLLGLLAAGAALWLFKKG